MRTARTEILALIMGVGLGVLVAACAAKQPGKTSQATEPPTGRDTGAAVTSPEIATLDDQIAHDLAQLGLEVPTQNDVISVSVAHSAPALPMSSHVAETCEAAPGGGACSDICTLADSICSNAHRICDLADELADEYSTQRCTSGKLSCERATGRCCDCE